MKSIEIMINNIGNDVNLFIDVEKNILFINGQSKNISSKSINNLIKIIRTWKSKEVDSKFIDEESFVIKIITNEGIDVIKGKGVYPDNYSSLKRWIGEMYD